MSNKISVIIPIYKVEKYIDRCARSLFCQTMQDIEYIFVNDCTPDDSVRLLQSVIDEYPKRKPYIKIISHERNMGSGIVRNTGLAAAMAPYIIYCDSDDWVEPDMYEVMYKKACEENADIVMCDYYKEKKEKRIYCSQNPYNHKEDIIEQMLVGKIHSSVCGRLVRKSLYDDNSVRFPEGINMWEDLVTSVQLHYFARKVSYISKPFYHYTQFNNSSLINTISLKIVNDKIEGCMIIQSFFRKHELIEKYAIPLKRKMLMAKMDLATNYALHDFARWKEIFPEINKDIMKMHIPLTMSLVCFLVDEEFYSLALFCLFIKVQINKIGKYCEKLVK